MILGNARAGPFGLIVMHIGWDTRLKPLFQVVLLAWAALSMVFDGFIQVQEIFGGWIVLCGQAFNSQEETGDMLRALP